MVNSPLIRPAIYWGGVASGGVPLGSHGIMFFILTKFLPEIVAIFGSPIVKQMANHSQSCNTKTMEMRDISIIQNNI